MRVQVPGQSQHTPFAPSYSLRSGRRVRICVLERRGRSFSGEKCRSIRSGYSETMRIVLLASCLLLGLCEGLRREELYPFGVLHDDDLLDIGDDVSSEEIQLATNIAFYEDYFSSIFVSVPFTFCLTVFFQAKEDKTNKQKTLILQVPIAWIQMFLILKSF